MMFTTCLLSVNKDFNILFIISALRRFMFTCAGTPLALPYQEFTKGMNPLAPPVRKGSVACPEQGVFREGPSHEKK